MPIALSAVVFLATVAYLPGVLEPTVSGRWAVLSVGSALLLLLVRRPMIGPGHLWGAALLGWAALSLIWSASPLDTAGELLHWLTLGMLFLAASRCRDPETVLAGLVAGLCLVLPFALEQMTGRTPVLATDVPSGLFLSRSALGEIAACALVWAAARRAWPLLPAPLILVTISGSRGALLACVCGCAVVGLSAGVRRWMIVATLVVLASGAVAITAWRDPALVSVLQRIYIWELAAYNVTPLGHGLETFGTLAAGIEYVHDDYLQLAFELGIGSLLLVPLLARGLRAGVPESGALAAILGAALVSFPSHHPTGAMLVALLAGLCCGARDRAQRGEHLLGMAGAVRSVYEPDSRAAADVRRAARGREVVAARERSAMGGGELAPDIREDSEGARA